MLNEKVIAITGGAGVLCAALARGLVAQGAKVALLDRNLPAAQAIADEINQAHAQVAASQALPQSAAGGNLPCPPVAMAAFCDVLDTAALQEAHRQVTAQFGNVDILINGAGGNHPRATTLRETAAPEALLQESGTDETFFGLNRQDMGFVFDLNILGTMLPSQVFGLPMARRGQGSILNISSMNAYRPLTKIPAYSAAKAAVSNFTQWLAVHLAPCGVRVNAIAPGFFVTQQNRALLFDSEGQPTPRAGKILAATPMARFGSPEELLGTVTWLLDDAKAGFVTGIIVPVDGGFSAYSGV